MYVLFQDNTWCLQGLLVSTAGLSPKLTARRSTNTSFAVSIEISFKKSRVLWHQLKIVGHYRGCSRGKEGLQFTQTRRNRHQKPLCRSPALDSHVWFSKIYLHRETFLPGDQSLPVTHFTQLLEDAILLAMVLLHLNPGRP